MKRLSPRKQVIGVGAWIKRTAESKWERVGFLFNSKGEASSWARAEYPNVLAVKAQSIRVTVTPRQPGSSWADRSDLKA